MYRGLLLRTCLCCCVHPNSGAYSSRSIWSCHISSPLSTLWFKDVLLLDSHDMDVLCCDVLTYSLHGQTFKGSRSSKGSICWMRWNEAIRDSSFTAYFFTLSVVFISIPFTLIIILYTVILIKLKIQKAPGEQLVEAQEHRTKRHRNVLKMAIVIVIGFGACWMPLNILVVMVNFENQVSCKITQLWAHNSLMGHVNCAINPCICFSF